MLARMQDQIAMAVMLPAIPDPHLVFAYYLTIVVMH